MSTIDFAVVLGHLRDTSQPFPAKDLYHFSDLNRSDLSALEADWPDIPVERRRSVIADLNDISEANFEVAFESVFRMALQDEDAEVRATSIRGLWESDSPELIAPFLDLLQNDPEMIVRAAAASALGRFVYLGEVDEVPGPQARRVEAVLLEVIQGDDAPEVRRRALEAMGYSGRPEMPGLISAAYNSGDPLFQASALFAMGRSSDAARWSGPVLADLEHTAPELRFEAARAAGELELAESVPLLTELTQDADRQIREAAIWSLSQIGGPEARRALTELIALGDEQEQEYIEDALDNLDFTDDLHAFSLFDFDEDDLDDADDGRLN